MHTYMHISIYMNVKHHVGYSTESNSAHAFWLKVPHSVLNLPHSFRMAFHERAPQLYALDCADGLLTKSHRGGLFEAEDIRAPWHGKSFCSVLTKSDGACGAHAQYGQPNAGVLAYSRGQLELR